MAINPVWTDHSGETSRIMLDQSPILESVCALRDSSTPALTRWQARVGEIFTARDPVGDFYRVRLVEIGPRQSLVVPFVKIPDPEPAIPLVLFQALPARERFELILQKAVELGATHIVPYVCRHSIRLDEREAQQPKAHRWPTVILRAARQCRRWIIPELTPVMDWSLLLEHAGRLESCFLCHPQADAVHLWSGVQNAIGKKNLGLIVGPEGGFAAEEIAAAKENGISCVSMGPRILRTETAAIMALSLASALLIQRAKDSP
jgi:16S rRNA (uracil1498-N3)-methyltransferase